MGTKVYCVTSERIKNLKILQINTTHDIKTSTGRTMIELDLYLKKTGHSSYMAYSQGEHLEGAYKIGGTFGKKIHALLARVTGLEGYFSRVATHGLLRYMEKVDPDVIRVANVHSNYINLPMFFKWVEKKNKPVVLTLDDCWYYTGKCTHYTTNQCYNWQSKCGNCPKLKEDIPSYFLDRTSKMLLDKKKWYLNVSKLGVVGVSNWIVEEAKKSVLNSAKMITRIYNWIDLEIFSPNNDCDLRRKLGLPDKKIILAVASFWGKSKGIELIIEVAKQVEDNIMIVLIGKVPAEIKLPDNIMVIGSVNNPSELAAYYNVADVYFNASLEESFGKVTAEALACGTPALVINSTASPEIVGNNCGYVAQNNLEDVMKGLSLLLAQEKVNCSNKCREWAQRNFAPETCMKQYVDIFEQLINGE